MKKFENVTSNENELAVKIGNSVPDDAVGVSFISSDPISPGNSLSMLDVSNVIVENKTGIDSSKTAEIVYADEFGILKRLDGRNSFPVEDVTISNLFLSKPTLTENLNVNEIDPYDFVHYFYISRFFIAAPPVFPLPNIKFWTPTSAFKGLNIGVVDSLGRDYKDSKTGKSKYRILLEPFLTESNYNRTEVPCRIIVLLDADAPSGLRLVYDKVECDEYGNFFNQYLRYSEVINSVKYFNEIPEETFVIDPNYSEKQNYSLKKINQKYSDLVYGEISPTGYQIVTPNKAIKDPRTFEAFNWRMIARTNRSINFELNQNLELDENGNIIQQTVKCGVLYSSLNNDNSNSVIHPYIFNRLENSPFNLSKYSFINPVTSLTDETYASYWKVDIDLIDDLSDFDILAWSPTSNITANQAQKINSFLRKSGTLILDLSSGSINATSLSQQLAIATAQTVADDVSIIESANIIDPAKNGGWEIYNTSFEKEAYSILGSIISYNDSATPSFKSYLTFDKQNQKYAESNSFLNISSTSNSNPISVGLVIDFPNSGDTVSKGSIIATTFPLMSYCNSIYGLGFYESVYNLNIGDTAIPAPLGNTYAAVLEGPFKLLYNIVAYGLYSRSKASRYADFRSALFNFVTSWKSSWALDSSALLDSEKSLFSNINLDSTTQVYARDLTPSSSSIFNFYISQLDLFLPENQKAILATLTESDVEFFIELTNDDISIANSEKISRSDYSLYNMPSSYNLFKLNDGISKLFAYTLKPSRKLEVPEMFGPYAVIEQNQSVSETSSLENKLPVLNNFKSYPFDFDCKYTYTSISDGYQSFNADIETEFIATFSAELTTIETTQVLVDPDPIPGYTVTETINVSKKAINIKSSIDDLNLLRTTTSTDPTNVFLYSGDIDIHKDPRIWKYSYTSESNYPSDILPSGTYSAYLIYNYWFGYPDAITFYNIVYEAGIFQTVKYSPSKDKFITYSLNVVKPPDELIKIAVYNSYDLENSSSNYISHEYVKYIQYTMATIGGQACKVDGLYGPQTANAVKNFQIAKNQRYKDGSVDSETKSYMAFAWKNLKASNPTLFNTYKANVPDSVITKYITAVENSPRSSQINGTNSYKKLSFSGFSGPTTASDIIWFEIPDGITYIDNIVIDPDIDPKWRNFSIVAYGYHTSYTTDIFTGKFINTNLSAVSISPKINMGGITRANARYMWVWITGSSISGFGSAEGFSIKGININGRYVYSTFIPGTDPPPYYVDVEVTNVTGITVSAKVIKSFNNLSVDIYNDYRLPLDTNMLTQDCYISELKYMENGQENRRYFGPNELNIGDQYDIDGLKVNFGISPSNLIYDSGEIIQVRSQNLVVDNNFVGISVAADFILLTTSAMNFTNSVTITNSNHIENYRLRNLSGNLFPSGINSVTVNDGVLLICNSSGGPLGLLTENDIRNSIEEPSSITEQEIDLRYGYMIVKNLLPNENGFIYGFYDLVQKEFLGKVVSVLDIYERGFSNVYIGVCAIDADGNTQNNNDYIGPTVDMVFKPVDIPFKSIAPIYSLKFSNTSLVKVSVPDKNLGKFDVWELPVSTGSFVKKVSIPSKNWSDWKLGYIGQELTAVYSTFDIDCLPTSEIFGKGYYSIFGENPKILNEKLVQVSRTPILSWNHKTDYISSTVGIVRPEVNVYFREDNSWTKIDYSAIRDIDCANGLIEFKKKIVPSDRLDIKIDYTVSLTDNLITQSNGIPIPLNPLLNKDALVYNKPLYIYIKPKLIYKKDINQSTIPILPPISELQKNTIVSEYSVDSIINFTYDSSIFSESSENYDPFALQLAVFYVYNNPYNKYPKLTDIRVRGGGFKDDINVTSIIDSYPDIVSSWDIYPPKGKAYPKGGYVVIRIPESVKSHFNQLEEIYNIISANLTAGIVYELQDMEGNPWSRDAE